MNKNVIIPTKLIVGIEKNRDSKVGKLAYYDESNKIKQEKLWKEAIDKNLGILNINNEPIKGFRLTENNLLDTVDWNNLNVKLVVRDPRGFEFEMTIGNLIYLMYNKSYDSGANLKGEFVYGWSGRNMMLIPTTSKDYELYKDYTKQINSESFVKEKDLKIGASYISKNNKEYVYMGVSKFYGYNGNSMGNHVWLIEMENGKPKHIRNFKSAYRKFIAVKSEQCLYDLDMLKDIIERDASYCPIDRTNVKYIPYTFEEFKKSIQGKQNVYKNKYGMSFIVSRNTEDGLRVVSNSSINNHTYEEAFRIVEPCFKAIYLMNGKLYSIDR